MRMRSGNKRAGITRDHIKVVDLALAPLPKDFCDAVGAPKGCEILMPTDGDEFSREFPYHLHFLGRQFSD